MMVKSIHFHLYVCIIVPRQMTINITQSILSACVKGKCNVCGNITCGLMKSKGLACSSEKSDEHTNDIENFQSWVMLVCDGQLPIDFLMDAVGLTHLQHLHEIAYVAFRFNKGNMKHTLNVLSHLVDIAQGVSPTMYPELSMKVSTLDDFIKVVLKTHKNSLSTH